MSKEEKIIKQLFKMAEKRQKIIERIAVMVGMDPVQEYLMRAIPVAAANVGINNVVVTKVDSHKGSSTDSMVIEGTYTAFISGIPPKRGEDFKVAWDKQLAAQKPELVGKVSFIFE